MDGAVCFRVIYQQNQTAPNRGNKILIMSKENLENFTKMLNVEPPSEKVETLNKFKYLPISYLESLMDRLFFGLWSSEANYQQIFNEITCTVKVTYTHPVNDKEYCKTGVASVQVQQDAGTAIAEFTQKKKKNALQTNLPKARAEAFKNAVQQLGKTFGRDLGRKTGAVSDFKPLLAGRETLERKMLLKLVQGKISTCKDNDQLSDYIFANEDFFSDRQIVDMVEKKQELFKLSIEPATNDSK